ncbi:U32 family peptidase [Agrobacterium tumefaciens]|uniref:Uncharacterized protein n=1 Tax=Agrobacterium tumefaciens TaxID=358 RepID=A0A4D7YE38_AGRTU|nr:U32 family peptidase [Agrobacterium tumefaciens]QCL95761.1 hypothetical protein CFBP7129_15865 [Agrobacterium tumefaciens]
MESNTMLSQADFLGIEVPSINSLKELQGLIKMAKELDIPVTQVNEVLGASLIPKTELKEMLHLCAEEGLGITLSTTVRPEYESDTAFYRTPWGREQGRRINAPDKLQRAFDETVRFIEMGCRGFIIYDIGLARLLDTARKQGEIPSAVIIKASTHCGITNYLSAQIHVENGVDDVIPMHDLSLSALQSIRTAIPDVAMSVITDTYATKGGFVRLFDVPGFIEKLCPLFLKMGNSLQHDPASGASSDSLPARMRRIRAILDASEETLVKIGQPPKESRFYAVPVV